MRPYAERHGLTLLQLACAWNLAQPAVRCVAPTLIQEGGEGARPVEEKRAELAALASGSAGLVASLTAAEVEEIRAIGDNTGCMALKGASIEHDGPARADAWGLDEQLAGCAGRWQHRPATRPRKRRRSQRATTDRGPDEHRRERHQAGAEGDVDGRGLPRGRAPDRAGRRRYVVERAGAGARRRSARRRHGDRATCRSPPRARARA